MGAARRCVVTAGALSLAALLAAGCDRLPLTPGYRFRVVPDTLEFAARLGGLSPIPRYFTVTAAASGSWTVSSDAAWAVVTPDSGDVPIGRVVVAPEIAGLPLGSYLATLRFSSPNAVNSPYRAFVRLVIGTQASLSGRWVGTWSTGVLSLDVRDSAGVALGTGEITGSGIPFAVSGTRSGDRVAFELRPAAGAPIALNAFFYSDHILRGALTGTGFAGDSVLLFRQ